MTAEAIDLVPGLFGDTASDGAVMAARAAGAAEDATIAASMAVLAGDLVTALAGDGHETGFMGDYYYSEIEAAIRELLRDESPLIWSFGRTGNAFELHVNREVDGLTKAVQERWGKAVTVRADPLFGYAPNFSPDPRSSVAAPIGRDNASLPFEGSVLRGWDRAGGGSPVRGWG